MRNNKSEVYRPTRHETKRQKQRRRARTQRNKSSSSRSSSSSNKSNSLNGVFKTILTPKKKKAITLFGF